MADTLYRWLIGGGFALAATLCMVCTATITPRRTYYPLLRIIFGLSAGIYGMSAAGAYFDAQPDPHVRLITVGAVVGMLLACAVFIWRRNRVPQWVATDLRQLRGHEPVDWETLDTSILASLSVLRHGAADAETSAQFRAALAEWDHHQAGTRRFQAQVAARKAAKRAREEGP